MAKVIRGLNAGEWRKAKREDYAQKIEELLDVTDELLGCRLQNLRDALGKIYSLALSGLIFEVLHNTDLRLIDDFRVIRKNLETIRDFLREEKERLNEQGVMASTS